MFMVRKIRGLEDYVKPAPEEEFHSKTSSSEESEDGEWVTEKDDNGNNNCDTHFKEISTSDDENQD